VEKMIVDQGNEIANHTYTHPHTKNTNITKLEKEIEKTHQTILAKTNTVPTLFRPPEGYFNKKIVTLAKNNGYRVILWSWSQDTRDWANPGVKTIINKVLKNAKNGDIIIFHDCGGDRSQTLKALGPVIVGLKEQGFELVTVTQLLNKWDPPQNTQQK
jgi:peptidoglycan/xylan/chitin deacetylase (PgdA/CDA1 family)